VDFSKLMRAPVTLLLLVVLALRSLVPTGFMLQPTGTANGDAGPGFEVVIWTGSGPATLTLDADGKTPPPNSQHVEKSLCPFAAAGAAALAATEPRTLEGEVAYAAVRYTLAVALFAETPRTGATSARGPPSQLI